MPKLRNSETKLPLEGIRIVDITLVWAGPHCTQLLAEWGAEVIRVEPISILQPNTRGQITPPPPHVIEQTRGTGNILMSFPNNDPGSRPWNRSASFNSHARNKLSMTLNLNGPDGLAIFERLISKADVFIENNVPETIERLHITYEELVKSNPQLIMLRMPGYGLSGPYKNYRMFGTHMEGMVGHHYIRSYPDLTPDMAGDAFTGDAAAGVCGAFAVMMALRHKRHTGEGQLIEFAQAENFMPYIGEVILDYTMNGRITGPQGNRHPSHAPHNVYPCKGEDRWIAVDVGSQEEWKAFCQVLGNPEWVRAPYFEDPVRRWQNQEELDGLIGQWTIGKDNYELFQAFQKAGVTAGPIQDEADAFNCPQLKARGFFEELDHPEFGKFQYPGLMFRMKNSPNKLRRYPPRLGEDNEYVYKQVIGVSDQEYRRLEEQGHIGMDFLPSAYEGGGP